MFEDVKRIYIPTHIQHVTLNLITSSISIKHVLYTAIVQITKQKTEEELDLCMIKVQKSKLIKIVRDDRRQ